jgi:hypothetical protein
MQLINTHKIKEDFKMFCGKCGALNNENDKFCVECGVGLLPTNQPLQGQPIWSNQGANPNPSNGGYAYQEANPNQSSSGYAYQGANPNPPSGGYHYQEAMPGPKNINKKLIGIIVGISGILAVMIALGIFLIMRTTYIEVPDLAELTEEEAIVLIEESRLVLGDIDERYSRTVDEGLVISQSPRAGREVERGETIDLIISLGTHPDEASDSIDLVMAPDSIESDQPDSIESDQPDAIESDQPDYNGAEQPDYNGLDQPDSTEFERNIVGESASPFNFDVWGEDSIVTLEYSDMTLNVPIPPGLNTVDDLTFCDTECCLQLILQESQAFLTSVLVRLRDIPDNLTFSQIAEAEIDFMVSEQRESGYYSDIDTTLYHLSEGELAAGIRLYGHPENGNLISHFFLYKFNEYNGYMIMTLINLRTDDANRIVITDELASAYGVWRYIDAGFLM